MDSRSGAATSLVFAMGALIFGCPIGCPPGNPQTIYPAAEERLAVNRIGPCVFEVAAWDPRRPFPRSAHGFYGIELNGQAVPVSWVAFDDRTRRVTVLREQCRKGIETLAMVYQPITRVQRP
jgi:hypothetical protein